MKRYFTAAIAVAGLCVAASGSPQAVYQNSRVLTNPPVPGVDAVAFVNSGVMDFINESEQEASFTIFPETVLPYSTRDTQYFTNLGSGIMAANPGFQFETFTATGHHSAKSFVNNGSIIAVDTFQSPLFPGYGGNNDYLPGTGVATPSVLSVSASSIFNSGTMAVGSDGWLNMAGQTISNRNGTLVAGDLTGNDPYDVTAIQEAYVVTPAGGGAPEFRYFVAPASLSDLFWGGTNGNLALNVWGSGFPSTPPIFSRVRSTLDTETVGLSLPLSDIVLTNGINNLNIGNLPEFATYIYTYYVNNPTNIYYNIVFVNTNFADTNISCQVGFSPDTFINPFFSDALPASATLDLNAMEDIVRFSVASFDATTGQMATNSVFLLDDGAASSNSTVYIYTNTISPNSYGRPDFFEVDTTTPAEWSSAFPSNDVADVANIDEILYPGFPTTYTTKSVPYAAATYGVQVGWNPEALDGGFAFTESIIAAYGLSGEPSLDIPDPTEQPGQINLQAGQLDLTGARIRAEGMVTLGATNLTRSATAGVDWGTSTSTLGATNGVLLISNIFPTTFQRIRGNIFAWSGNWQVTGTNSLTTNNYTFHVLVVDQTLRGHFSPTVRNLTLHGKKSTEVEDPLTVINQSYFDATNLTFNSAMTFNQNAQSLVSSNLPNLKNFLNNTNGVLTVSDLLDLGVNLTTGQANPGSRQYTITSITNLGEIIAASPTFQSAYFENDGIIFAQNDGSLSIAASILGCGLATGQTNYLVAEGNITLSAQTMQITNSYWYSGYGSFLPGSLLLDATLHLSDGVSGGPEAAPNLVNYWQVNNGFTLAVKPATGDLFGTEIRTIATSNQVVNHVWAGDSPTNIVAGFSNNVVIGHLILDRQSASATLHFSAAGTKNALYVDYLELADFSYSDYRNGLEIDPNMTIYFAAANADPIKLMAVHPGLVWVSNFWGPNSSYAVPYNGDTNIQCYMNSAVASNLDYGFFSGPNYYNLPYVLNDPNCHTNIAPCPSETTTHLYVIGTGTCSGRAVYNSLITGVSGQGTITPVLQQEQLALGSNYTLTANPAAGWLFSGWTVSGGTGANFDSAVLTFTFTSNTVITANFILNPFPTLQGVYNGLFFNSNGVTPDSLGKFTLTLTKTGAFSGSLLVQSNAYTFSGQFGGSGLQQVRATSAHQPALTANLALDTAGTSGQIHGDISNGTWDSQLSADLAPAYTTQRPSPLAGSYTLSLPWNASAPGGDGYGVVTVSALGVASVAGSLGDGAAFSQSAPVSKYGEWPFYTYISSGNDTVIGWIDLSTNELTGANTSWSKAASNGPYYAKGFTNLLQLVGSPYAAPKKNATVLSLANPSITISGGNLAETLTDGVTLKSETYSAGTNVTLTISPASGSFSGTFYDPNTRNRRAINGVVLQNQAAARGYFLGTNESGTVLLEGH